MLLGALGESSTWGFSRRTFALMQKLFPYPDTPVIALNEQGAAYSLKWELQEPTDLQLDNLPSLEYAVYLVNAVKFHIGQLFHIMDDQLFSQQLNEFYSRPVATRMEVDRLWSVQLLVILAFGKAFVVHERGPAPPGSEFFAQAMSLLPGFSELYKDILTAIEVLTAMALYLQSVDRRNVAYLYVS